MIRRWLKETLTEQETIPYGALKYIFLIISSVIGGFVFASSGSWLRAIQYDFWMYACCWAMVKPSEWAGAAIVRALLRLLPLYTVE